MDFKRTIDELTTLYDLEPDIRDIFVEGSTDKSFLDWYLRRKRLANVSVYPIDLVDVPNSLLEAFGFQPGSNRCKVVALSRALARHEGSPRRVMCIIDRDSDGASFAGNQSPYLFQTDGNSIELYAFTPAVMEKFLLVTLGGFPRSVDALMSQIMRILERVYAIRQANESLGWGMSWIPFLSYVTLDTGTLSFRESDFTRAYLQKNKRWPSRLHFTEAVADILRKMSPDPKRRMRGHDLADIVRMAVMKLQKARSFGNSDTVEGCLMTAIESGDLERQPLFIAIEQNAR
jgi:hypothetical protein